MGWRKHLGQEVRGLRPDLEPATVLVRSTGTLKDHLAERARFPAWLARLKGIGKAPTADGEIAQRATPEPDVALL